MTRNITPEDPFNRKPKKRGEEVDQRPNKVWINEHGRLEDDVHGDSGLPVLTPGGPREMPGSRNTFGR